MLTAAALCLVGMFPDQAKAQRCLPAQKGIQLTAGWVDGFSFSHSDGRTAFHGGIAYSRYNRNLTRWVFGAEYLQKDYNYRDEVVPKVQITGEAGYYVPVLADRGRNVVLSVGFSGLAGYETTNWGNKLLHDGARLRNEDCFLYGGALSAEVETFLSDRVVFLLSVRERVLGGSTVGTFHTQIGFGFKFLIN